MTRLRAIDSHTGGEPTRVVYEGFPNLGSGTVAERALVLREKFDHFRSAIVNEPRGSDVLVGALLVPPSAPSAPSCHFGVIFFNNVGLLGMCGHGMIGLRVTLAHLNRVGRGKIMIDTPVGVVRSELFPDNSVSVENVPSWRQAAQVPVTVTMANGQTIVVHGDVAWGGNWFFLASDHGQEISLANAEALIDFAWRLRQAVNSQGFAEVDHVELFGPPAAGGDSRNFVLCPGKAYDRSPCGTGTSAKLACLAADGKLAEGEPWVQESIVGSKFTGTFQWIDRAAGKIAPTITGSAYLTGELTLHIDQRDPFCWGLRT